MISDLDLGATDANDYAQRANSFYNNRSHYRVKTDSDGTIRVFDPVTNTFGSYNANGSTRTFYKPTGGLAYWNRQPGN